MRRSILPYTLTLVCCIAIEFGICHALHNSSFDQGNEMWISGVEHGIAAFNKNQDYKVYRNVMDFGCVGDGVADDTVCINTAISSGGRCGQGCGGSTLSPALIYFPSGIYKISSPIIMYYYSQLVGNARNPPTIVAIRNFQGIAMLDSDPYDKSNKNWYTNQNNAFRQVRNFVLDYTLTSRSATTIGIHWQVAQATSLVNIHFKMRLGSNHQGIYMENGSGGFMSDLKFEGGKFGMRVGNQQFMSARMSFSGCETAIVINWNWFWSFKSLTISNSKIGIDMSSQTGQGKSRVGSVLLQDSTISDTQTGVLLTSAALPSRNDVSDSLLIDNVRLVNTPIAVGELSGTIILVGGNTTINMYGRGSTYKDKSGNAQYVMGSLPKVQKYAGLLDKKGNFFEKSRPQYEQLSVNDFASVKAAGAKGDGKADDTYAIQNVINENAYGKVVYFPSGTYLISKTIKIPPGTRMIGEVWSVLTASGSVFQDQNRPTAMLQVGKPGESGSVEISDVMFSTKGAQPGAVLVQWNLKASSQGAASMHDSHFRVGGFTGSELQVSECPRGQNAVARCNGAHTLLHITATGGGYFENVWVWTADHDWDNGVAQSQISIYSGRGVLVEANPGPVWLYGVQSEHHVLYQYQLSNAHNVYMTMLQSETPYWQPRPPAPQPFNPSILLNDPTYAHCDGRPQCQMSYDFIATKCANVYVYGAGMYNFFNDYSSSCLSQEDCQDNMINLEDNSNFYMFDINTKGSTNMVVSKNTQVLARQADNKNGFCQTINAFLVEA